MSKTISELTQRKLELMADCAELIQMGLNSPEAHEQYRKMLEETEIVQGDLDILLRIEMTQIALKNRQPASRAKNGRRHFR